MTVLDPTWLFAAGIVALLVIGSWLAVRGWGSDAHRDRHD